MKNIELKALFPLLKKLGAKIETDLNTVIQESLNKDEVIEKLNAKAAMCGKMTNHMKEYMEIISSHFNIPTKTDVANVAKLTIQTEEKIDHIEEQLLALTQLLMEGKGNGDLPFIPSSALASRFDDDTDKQIRSIKKLLKMNLILNSPFSDTLTSLYNLKKEQQK